MLPSKELTRVRIEDSLSRRMLITALAVGAVGLAAANVMPAGAQTKKKGPSEVPVEELMKPRAAGPGARPGGRQGDCR